MPIYEYKCESCGAVTELLQRMNDEPLKKCPKCSGRVEKIFSRSSFQLKGSGWYVTDYGKGTGGAAGMTKKAKSDESSSSGSKSESSKNESKSSDSKSESKGESKGESRSDSKGESRSDSKGESRTRSRKTGSAKSGD